MLVELRYWVSFGKGDSSDDMSREIELTPEEEIAYNNAIKNEIPLDEVKELQDALERAYNEIEQEEIGNALDFGEEYVMECQGESEMDCDELNELVHNHDPHALEYFGLDDATDEEIEEWDAYDLDEVPTIADFDEDFEPSSPYDEGWTLNVEFVEPDYDEFDDEEDADEDDNT